MATISTHLSLSVELLMTKYGFTKSADIGIENKCIAVYVDMINQPFFVADLPTTYFAHFIERMSGVR